MRDARGLGPLRTAIVHPRSADALEARLRAMAEQAGLSSLQCKVDALRKGSLHTDESLGAVVAPGLEAHTGRRISHVYAMGVQRYHKPLIVTAAAINITTLARKLDICQNAVDLLQVMGVATLHVAVLTPVETVVAPAMPATLDAAALTVMAMRSQITRCAGTDRWLSTTPSTWTPRAPSTSFPPWAATPSSCWCRTWRPATCWPSSSFASAGLTQPV